MYKECPRCEVKSFQYCKSCKDGSNFKGLSLEEWKKQRKAKAKKGGKK